MNLKIFKLRSGEEIICQVIEELKTKYKILNPLVFKSTSSFDQHGSYDMTILRDWLEHTDVKTITIPKNHIALEMVPNDDTVNLYNLQLKSEKEITEKIVDIQNEQNVNELNGILDSILGDIMQSMQSQHEHEELSWNKPKRKHKLRKPHSNQFSLPSPEMNPGEMDRHGIYVSMMIPAEALMNLITSGLLNPKDLLKMINEVKKKNRFTGDETDRQDFGNKLSDWNPNPDSNDYK